MGNHWYGKRNDRVEAILEFALDNDMVICNTLFQQKECRKWTWQSPNQHTTNMIDLILINRKWRTAVAYNNAELAKLRILSQTTVWSLATSS